MADDRVKYSKQDEKNYGKVSRCSKCNRKPLIVLGSGGFDFYYNMICPKCEMEAKLLYDEVYMMWLHMQEAVDSWNKKVELTKRLLKEY